MTSQVNWEEKAGHWFLAKVLRILVKEFRETIMMGRFIMKNPLYSRLSWWFRLSQSDTREVLRDLSKAFPGIALSNRGIKISSTYLERDNWMPCSNEAHPKVQLHSDPKKGGDSDEAVE